jgi:hypothetical protein
MTERFATGSAHPGLRRWDMGVGDLLGGRRDAGQRRADEIPVVAAQRGDRGITVELDGATKGELLALARGRNDGKAPTATRRKEAGWSDLELNFLGLKGEWVVEQVCGVPFDRTSYGASGDRGRDVVIDGRRYAIKTAHRAWGLVVERGSDADPTGVEGLIYVEGPCDGGCWCRDITRHLGDTERWRLVGWVPIWEFWAQADEVVWRNGRRWRMHDGFASIGTLTACP